MAETYFAKKGLEIIYIEHTNYQKLYQQGPSYLYKIVEMIRQIII